MKGGHGRLSAKSLWYENVVEHQGVRPDSSNSDISEFESYHPSHGVGSLRAGIRALFPRPGVALWSQRVLVSSCEPRREATEPSDRGRRPSTAPKIWKRCSRQPAASPIVFVNLTDPVGAGFVESLARLGGNTTGFTSYEYGLSAKWVAGEGNRAARDARELVPISALRQRERRGVAGVAERFRRRCENLVRVGAPKTMPAEIVEKIDHPQFEGPRPEVPMPNSQDSMSLRRFTLAAISCNLLNGAGGLQKDERASWTRQTRARCCSY
jgi:hypothetical protein